VVRPARRWLAFAGFALLVVAPSAAAWKLGLLDSYLPRSPRERLESGLVSAHGSPRPITPPRVESRQFKAGCAQPAPVYVYDGASVPSTFRVLVAAPAGTGRAVADSLVRRYELLTAQYDAARRGFVATLAPNDVARLRCDREVGSLEEVPL
jgi:hypothetical protein